MCEIINYRFIVIKYILIKIIIISNFIKLLFNISFNYFLIMINMKNAKILKKEANFAMNNNIKNK